jgi:hypothetical protein
MEDFRAEFENSPGLAGGIEHADNASPKPRKRLKPSLQLLK